MDDSGLLVELTATAEAQLDRHLASAREWFPHTMVPWGRGRDFQADEVWSDMDSALTPEVQSALFVNLLTEDNLPFYFRTIERVFGAAGVWGEWVRRWTAEEGRHSIVIRDYLTVSRSIDPVALERGRMAQVCGGQVPEPPSVADGFAYVALQELATRVAHRNTGKLIEDPVGYEIMARVAADENLHFLFYRDLVSAALEVDPDGMMQAIERQVKNFEMPGTGIPDFSRHARRIAQAGIYNFAIHYDSVLLPVVERQWRIGEVAVTSDQAKRAQASVMTYVGRVKRAGERLAARAEVLTDTASVPSA